MWEIMSFDLLFYMPLTPLNWWGSTDRGKKERWIVILPILHNTLNQLWCTDHITLLFKKCVTETDNTRLPKLSTKYCQCNIYLGWHVLTWSFSTHLISVRLSDLISSICHLQFFSYLLFSLERIITRNSLACLKETTFFHYYYYCSVFALC